MSEVMRWKLKGFLPGVEGMCKAVMRPEVVMASDYDAAQVELAALREELAESGRADHLRQRISFLTTEIHKQAERLAAAEQRNADHLSLLHMSKELLSTISLHRTMAPNDWCDSFKNEVADRLEKLRAVLAEPTESGASE